MKSLKLKEIIPLLSVYVNIIIFVILILFYLSNIAQTGINIYKSGIRISCDKNFILTTDSLLKENKNVICADYSFFLPTPSKLIKVKDNYYKQEIDYNSKDSYFKISSERPFMIKSGFSILNSDSISNVIEFPFGNKPVEIWTQIYLTNGKKQFFKTMRIERSNSFILINNGRNNLTYGGLMLDKYDFVSFNDSSEAFKHGNFLFNPVVFSAKSEFYPIVSGAIPSYYNNCINYLTVKKFNLFPINVLFLIFFVAFVFAIYVVIRMKEQHKYTLDVAVIFFFLNLIVFRLCASYFDAIIRYNDPSAVSVNLGLLIGFLWFLFFLLEDKLPPKIQIGNFIDSGIIRTIFVFLSYLVTIMFFRKISFFVSFTFIVLSFFIVKRSYFLSRYCKAGFSSQYTKAVESLIIPTSILILLLPEDFFGMRFTHLLGYFIFSYFVQKFLISENEKKNDIGRLVIIFFSIKFLSELFAVIYDERIFVSVIKIVLYFIAMIFSHLPLPKERRFYATMFWGALLLVLISLIGKNYRNLGSLIFYFPTFILFLLFYIPKNVNFKSIKKYTLFQKASFTTFLIAFIIVLLKVYPKLDKIVHKREISRNMSYIDSSKITESFLNIGLFHKNYLSFLPTFFSTFPRLPFAMYNEGKEELFISIYLPSIMGFWGIIFLLSYFSLLMYFAIVLYNKVFLSKKEKYYFVPLSFISYLLLNNIYSLLMNFAFVPLSGINTYFFTLTSKTDAFLLIFTFLFFIFLEIPKSKANIEK